jgi:hypothetical protein
MRGAGHMTSTGEENRGFWLGKLKERFHLEHLDADGSITLIWTLQKRVGVS